MSDLVMILNLLLDRYERSKHYQEPGGSARSIFLRYDRETLPDYWDEHHWQRRTELNQATRLLETEGLVRVRSSRYSPDEVERVDLALDQVDAAYRRAKRAPRRQLEQSLASVARTWSKRWPADWRQAFAGAVESAVAEYGKLPAGLKPDEHGLLEDLCRTLDALGPTGLTPELPRRLFSQRVLGDSKRFEVIQSRFVRVLREFWPGSLPEADREILAEVGILENPQQVLLAGPVVLGDLSVASVGDAVGLPASFVDRCEVTRLDADSVITVENLTSFHQVVGAHLPRTVVVYLGGYHNRIRRQLLLKLARASALEFWHWGDIDLGGFRIFVHLQERTGLPLRPLLMDRATYLEHYARGMDCTPSYLRELEGLLSQAAFAPFHETIREMLVRKKRVEQESVSFDKSALR